MIRVTDLVKHFGPTKAVDGISFSVEQGEVVGFLGPNGAGKTTTIRVLTCFHPATAGHAEVAGFDVDKQPVEVRQQVGYLPENVPIYPDMRVVEYLYYRAALKGVSRRLRRAAVESAMEQCDVTEVRRKLVGHISRGFRQRVGLADALVARPPILILDEPTSGLDPNQRRRIKALVRELANEHTVLFSSHILSEVEDVSSRILVISNGRIRADGKPRELLAQSGGRRLCAIAGMPGGALQQLVAGLDGVFAAAVTDEGDGFSTVYGSVRPEFDPRDQAFAGLQTAGVPIRELRLDLPRLEDFFQEVTEGQDSQDDNEPDGLAAAEVKA